MSAKTRKFFRVSIGQTGQSLSRYGMVSVGRIARVDACQRRPPEVGDESRP